jgi:PadR family transcriptional regulator, regulatory protein PadR
MPCAGTAPGSPAPAPPHAVYPALHRLERADLLASDWDDSSGRRRRTYRLTESGRSALREQQRAWETFAGAVTSVLRGAPWPSTT